MLVNTQSYPSLAMDEIIDIFGKADYSGLNPINFGKGISCFNPFDHVDVKLSRSCLAEHIPYGEISGLMSLRLAICRYYQESFNYDLSPDRVCITDGASGALTIALAMLLEDGGEIILPESCYPIYNVLAKIFNADCQLVPVKNDFCIDVEKLAHFISRKTSAIVINSPSNPHGAFLSANKLEAISRLGVPVIFDEVYQSLPLVDEVIPSAIHFSNQHFIVNSLSKSLAIAGFRVGYLIVPEEQVQLVSNIKAVLNMCTSLPSQLLAESLLQNWDELLDKHRTMLRENWIVFKRTINYLGLKLRTQPKAGFFALLDVADVSQDSMQISRELANHYALASVPGIDFQDSDHAFLRLNFACHSHQIEPGLVRLAEYLKCAGKQPVSQSLASKTYHFDNYMNTKWVMNKISSQNP